MFTRRLRLDTTRNEAESILSAIKSRSDCNFVIRASSRADQYALSVAVVSPTEGNKPAINHFSIIHGPNGYQIGENCAVNVVAANFDNLMPHVIPINSQGVLVNVTLAGKGKAFNNILELVTDASLPKEAAHPVPQLTGVTPAVPTTTSTKKNDFSSQPRYPVCQPSFIPHPHPLCRLACT